MIIRTGACITVNFVQLTEDGEAVKPIPFTVELQGGLNINDFATACEMIEAKQRELNAGVQLLPPDEGLSEMGADGDGDCEPCADDCCDEA